MTFGGKVIDSIFNTTHLSHAFGQHATDNGIERRLNYVYRKTLVAKFRKASPFVRYILFKNYSAVFYGAPFWHLSSSAIAKVNVGWRKFVRKVTCLPYRTHCSLSPMIWNRDTDM